MKKSDFYFDLPERLIAQHPMEQRDASRMLVMDRKTGELSHRHFHDLIEYLKPGDCLVMNNSRVIPARLMGQAEGRTTPIEVVLLTDHGDGVWECLTRPGKKTREGVKLSFGDGLLTGVVESVNPKDGNRMIRFQYEGVFLELLEQFKEDTLILEANHTVAILGIDRLNHTGQQSVTERQLDTLSGLLARSSQAFPHTITMIGQQNDFDRRGTSFGLSHQACRNDARVIHNQAVTRL